jgi:hypothetical protein
VAQQLCRVGVILVKAFVADAYFTSRDYARRVCLSSSRDGVLCILHLALVRLQIIVNQRTYIIVAIRRYVRNEVACWPLDTL